MDTKVQKIKEFLNKEKCDCGAVATYLYMPSSPDDKSNPFYCSDCVSRGCSCNWMSLKDGDKHPTDEDGPWKWVTKDCFTGEDLDPDEGQIWVHLDAKGREYPCCEFMWEENGWFLK
jgi:hypothetical protein